MILISVMLIAGYFFLDSPSINAPQATAQYQIEAAKTRSVADCIIAAHYNFINGGPAPDCANKYQISTVVVCEGPCFYVTKSGYEYNIKTDDVLRYDANIGFGIVIFEEGQHFLLESGGEKIPVSDHIINTAGLQANQMTYITLLEKLDGDDIAVRAVRKIESVASRASTRSVAISGKAVQDIKCPKATACTDCERPVVDANGCAVGCVPDAKRLTDSGCYKDAQNCKGDNKAFFFGFPEDFDYMELVATELKWKGARSFFPDWTAPQNRKFNCLDCGTGRINKRTQLYPYVAECE